MTPISIVSFIAAGVICTLVRKAQDKKKLYQNCIGMQKNLPIVRPSSCQPENHDDEKKRFFGTIKSLNKEATLNEIITVNTCFYYKNSENVTTSYNVRSPYLVIEATANTASPFSQENIRERILSYCKDTKGVFINIEEKEKRKIQLAIPVSMAKHTDALRDILNVVEDTIDNTTK